MMPPPWEDLRSDLKKLIREIRRLNDNIEELERLNDNLEELTENIESIEKFLG